MYPSMAENIPVSIIVPVYKAEKYLDTCLKSIQSQTFPKFEIILVDDGSPDRSGEICDRYAESDRRIKVVHKENGGVSSARQAGIENASGEYTVHVDPDDWIEPCMLESMYSQALSTNADIVVCDYMEEKPGRSVRRKQNVPEDPRECVRMLLVETLHSACWNKLVRRSLYSENGVSFPQGINMWEDMATVPRLFAVAARVAYLPEALYHYVRYSNPNALTGNTSFEECMRRRNVIDILQASFAGDAVLSDYLVYLKLKVRTALLKGCRNEEQFMEALDTYPESVAVVWKHPTMSVASKVTASASGRKKKGFCRFMLSFKGQLRLHSLHDVREASGNGI